ncbi:YD repeat-containing protein [Fluviicoccus keumensis]|uniref:YD repeat-containing protein n=1 Tax=Fluviicoccus keumensis TaxID=1435465 RepID=A0A4Q7YMD5_9GAMM|nr:YwqJ-related putative deaminase [Fluviicoccus keumensis]RZU38488.1 YD repeat-containing protein [Fluviicoccus keumensis]
MVAIVTGNGLGLFNTSLNTLGGNGVSGQTGFGQANGRAAVNTATGNLILQFTDEQLSGLGQDLPALRTYNVLGQSNDADADGWRWDGERRLILTGTVNTAGSTVTRINGDGHETLFTWSGGRYQSAEGPGAHDSLSWSASDSTWSWVDGDTRATEVYEAVPGLPGQSRLKSVTDSGGTSLTYSYDAAGRLAGVRDSSGSELIYNYNAGGQLERLDTRLTGSDAPTKQVYYYYDTQGRLKRVLTDLTVDNSIADAGATPAGTLPAGAKVYVTDFAYEDLNGVYSRRISLISQSDGTSVSFKYQQVTVGGEYRVWQVTDASGVTTFDYGTGLDRTTTVSNGLGQAWAYRYDESQRLVEIRSPSSGGQPLTTTAFGYDSDSNLVSISSGSHSISYGYDTNGNRILEREYLDNVSANTLCRTYSATNKLLTETRYTTASTYDSVAAVWTDPATGQITRYSYDASDRLHYTVSAEGRVTEYRYSAQGLPERVIQYGGAVYAGTVSESALNTWVVAQDKTRTTLSVTQYDVRGNLSKRTDYATVDSSGNGVLDSAAVVTEYAYSGHGQLLQTIVVRGSDRSSRTTLASNVYDGLGRLQSQIDAEGSHTTVYDGAARTLTVTHGSGRNVTSTYDVAGRLLTVVEGGTGVSSRVTTYTYDDAGRLVAEQDAFGQRSFTFYDEAGRISARVDKLGVVTEYTYTATGRLSVEARYVTRVDTAGWISSAGVMTKTRIEQIRPTAVAKDRRTSYGYDAADRLWTVTDAAGVVTTHSYDARDQLVQTQCGDRTSRYFYDKDGRPQATLDGEGYLTENLYNAAGQLFQVKRYAVVTTPAQQAGATLADVRPSGTGALSTYYFYDASGRRTGVLDEQQFLTETAYDAAGNTQQTVRYATPYTVSVTALTLLGTVKAALLGGTSQTTTTAYDSLGRILTVTDAAGTVTAYEYDAYGRVVRETAAQGTSEERATRNRYDVLGQRVAQLGGEASTRITNGMSDASQAAVYRQFGSGYEYDMLGRKSAFTDAAGNRTVYYYDAEGRLTHTINAEGEVSETVYNNFGEIQETTRYTTKLASNQNDRATDSTHGGNQAARIWYKAGTNNSISRSLGSFNAGDVVTATVWFKADADTQGALYVGPASAGASVKVYGNGQWQQITVSYKATANGPLFVYLYGDREGANHIQGHQVVYDDLEVSCAAREFRYVDGFESGLTGWSGAGQPNDLVTATTASTYSGSGAARLWYQSGTPSTLSRNLGSVAAGDVVTATVWLKAGADTRAAVYLGNSAGAAVQANWIESVGTQGWKKVTITATATAAEDYYLYLNADAFNPAAAQTHAVTYDDVVVLKNGQFWFTDSFDSGVNQASALTATTGWFLQAARVDSVRQSTVSSFDGSQALQVAYKPGTSSFALLSLGSFAVGEVITATVWFKTTADTRARVSLGASGGSAINTAALDAYGVGDWQPLTVTGTVTTAGAFYVYLFADYNGAYKQEGHTVLFDNLEVVSSTRGRIYNHDFESLTNINVGGGLSRLTGAEGRESLQGGVLTTGLRALVQGIRNSATDSRTQYDYDNRGLLVKQTDGEGFETGFTYTDFGQLYQTTRQLKKGATPESTVMEARYNKRGERVGVTEDLGGLNRVTSTKYDAFGRIIEQTDALGKLTTTKYDSNGRQVTVTDPLSHVRKSIYDAYGRMLTQVDGMGNSTVYAYDDTNRTVTVTTPEGIALSTWKTRHGETLKVVDGRNNITTYEYNRDGQLTRTVDAQGNDNLNVYDVSGRMIQSTDVQGRQVHLEYDAANRIIRRLDEATNGNATRYAFDGQGRQIRVTEGEGSTAQRITEYSYDRNGQTLTVTVDPAGLKLTTSYAYDGAGRQLRISRGDAANPSQQVTAYAYDDLGRRISESQDPDGLNLTTLYKYDLEGRLTRKIDALGNSTWYVNDVAGLLMYTVDSEGQVTRYYYDANDRVISTLKYANVIAKAARDTYGDVVSSVTTAGTVTFSPPAADTVRDQRTYTVYDRDGRARYQINALRQVTETRYDAAGNVTETITHERELPTDTLSWPAATNTPDTGLTALTSSSQNLLNTYPGLFRYDAVSRRLVLCSVSNATTSLTQTLVGASRPFEPGQQYRMEITLGATLPSRLIVGLSNEGLGSAAGLSANNYRRHALYLTGGKWYSAVNDNSISATPLLGVANASTTYVLEIETRAGGTTLYVYEKGKTRADGYKDEFDTSGWDEARFTLYGLQSPSDTNGEAYIDNLSISTRTATTVVGNRTRYVYDSLNHQRFVIDPLGNVTEKRYDAAGHVTEVKRYDQPIPRETAATETDIQNALSLAGAGTQRTGYVYDNAGRLRFTVDALNQVTETRYDALGRVTETIRHAKVLAAGTVLSEAVVAAQLYPVWSDDLDDNAVSGMTVQSYPDVLSLSGGKITLTNAIGADVEPSIYESAFKAFSSGMVYQAEFTLGATLPKSFKIGLDNSKNSYGAAFRRHILFFDNGNLRSVAYSDTEEKSVLLGVAKINTTYVIELETRAEGTTLYVYEKGMGRDSGFSQSADAGAWTDMRFRIWGRRNPAYDNSTVSIDNLKEWRLNGTPTTQAAWSRTVYDAAGRTKFVLDPLNAVTEYIYDDAGRVIQEKRYTEALATLPSTLTESTVSAALQNKASVSTRREYDSAGRERYSVDALGYVTEKRFDAQGRVIESLSYARAIGADTPVVVSEADGVMQRNQYRYDLDGRLVYIIDALGNVTENRYDGLDRVTRTIQYAQKISVPASLVLQDIQAAVTATNGASPTDTSTTNKVYDRLNREVFNFDALGYVTGREYDVLGRLVKETRYVQKPVGTISYTEAWLSNALNLSPADAQVTRYVYDADDHLRFTVDALGHVSERAYDSLGRVVKEVRYVRTPVSTVSYTEAWLSDVGNLSAEDAQITRYVYDAVGHVRFTVDALGYVSERAYDALGRVVKEIRYAGNSDTEAWLSGAVNLSGAGAQVTRYGYDAGGRLLFTVDAMGYVTEQRYDSLGRVSSTLRHAKAINVDAVVTAADIDLAVHSILNESFTGLLSADLTLTTNTAQASIVDNHLTVRSQADGGVGWPRVLYETNGTIAYEVGKVYRGELRTGASLAGIYTGFSINNGQSGTAKRKHSIEFVNGKAVIVSNGLNGVSGGAELGLLRTDTTYVVEIETDVTGTTAYVYEKGLERSAGWKHRLDATGWNTASLSVFTGTGTGASGELSLDNVMISRRGSQPDAVAQQTRYVYDAAGHARFTVDALGYVSERAYDGLGRVVKEVRYADKPVGTVSYTEAWLSDAVNLSGAGAQVTRYGYDAGGRLLFTVDAMGYVTEQRYDSLGRVSSTLRHAKAINVDAVVTAADIDLAVHSILNESFTGLLSADLTLTTNTAQASIVDNHLTVRSQADGGVGWPRVLYETNGTIAYEVGKVYRGELRTGASLAGIYTGFSINNGQSGTAKRKHSIEFVNGKAVIVSNGLNGVSGGAELGLLRTDTTYVVEIETDVTGTTAYVYEKGLERSAGWKHRLDATGWNTASLSVFTGTGTGASGELSLDNVMISRRGSQPDAVAQQTRYVYDAAGHARFTVDALGYVSERAYDGLGRVVKEVRYADKPVGTVSYTEAWLSDAVNLSGAGAQVKRYVYDADNQLRFTVDAMGYVTEQRYDALGHVSETLRYPGAINGAAVATEADVATALRAIQVVDFNGGALPSSWTLNAAVTSATLMQDQLSIKTANAGTTNQWPNVLSGNLLAYETGMVYRTEVSTGNSLTGSSVWVSVDNGLSPSEATGTSYRKHRVLFSSAGITISGVNGQSVAQLTGTLKTNATYVVEYVTEATGTKVYVYEKGSRRETGLQHQLTGGGWTNIKGFIQTLKGPNVTPGAAISIDNISVSKESQNPEVDVQRTRYVYDVLGRVRISVDGQGNVDEKDYDSAGNLKKESTFRNSVVLSDADLTMPIESLHAKISASNMLNIDVRTVRYVYDSNGLMRFEINADGYVAEKIYDAFGQVVLTRKYNKSIDLPADDSKIKELWLDEEIRRVNTGPNDIVGTRVIYDVLGRKRETVGALGNVIEHIYDGFGRVIGELNFENAISSGELAKGINDLDLHVMVSALNTGSGNVKTTRHIYDLMGRERYTIDTLGYVSEKIYDDQGRLAETKAYDRRIAGAVGISEADVAVGLGKPLFSQEKGGGVAGQSSLAANTVTMMSTSIAGEPNVLLGYWADKIPQKNKTGVLEYFEVKADQTGSFQLGVQSGDYKHWIEIRNGVLWIGYGLDQTPLKASNVSANKTQVGTIEANAVYILEVETYDAGTTLRWYKKGEQADSGIVDARVGIIDGDFTVFGAALSFDSILGGASNAGSLQILQVLRSGPAVLAREKYYYDSLNRIKNVTDAIGGTESYEYDAFGNSISKTDKAGKVWRYRYDANGRISEEITPEVTVQGDFWSLVKTGYIVTHNYYDAFGYLTARKEGIIRIGSSPIIDGQFIDDFSQARLTRYGYDVVGNQILKREAGYYNTGSHRFESADEDSLMSDADLCRGLSLGEVQQSRSNGFYVYTQKNFNGFGEVTRVRCRVSNTGIDTVDYNDDYYFYTRGGLLDASIDAMGYVTKYDYDGFGNQKLVTRFSTALSDAVINNVSGRLTLSDIIRDSENDRTVRTEYDLLGRKTKVIQDRVDLFDSVAGKIAGSSAIIYSYDGFGNVVQETRCALDENDQSISMLGATNARYFFDGNGRKTGEVNALGYYTAYEYDALGHVVAQKEYKNAFVSDPLQLTRSMIDAKTQIDSGADRFTYFEYDALGRIIRSELDQRHYEFGSTAVVMSTVEYDAVGHIKSQTDKAGNKTENAYDDAGNLVQVIDPAKIAAKAGYLKLTDADQILASNVRSYMRNAFGDVVVETLKAGYVSYSWTHIAQQGETRQTRYAYDNNGHLVAEVSADVVLPQITGLQDLADRLGVLKYGVDASGNIISQKQKVKAVFDAWVVGGITQEYEHTIERSYVFDKLGRQQSTYDSGYSVTTNPSTAFYVIAPLAADAKTLTLTKNTVSFNAFGEIVSKTLNSRPQESYVYDKTGVVVSTYDAAGWTTTEHDYLGNITRVIQSGGVSLHDLNVAGRNSEAIAGYYAINALNLSDPATTRTTVTSFDLLGRQLSRQLPSYSALISGSLQTFTPSTSRVLDRWGNELSTTIGNITTQKSYDRFNRLTREEGAVSTIVDEHGKAYQAAMIKSYQYDDMDNVVQISDSVGSHLENGFAINEAVKRVKKTSYFAGTNLISLDYQAYYNTADTPIPVVLNRYYYDAFGNQIVKVNGAGDYQFYNYDAMNRVTSHGTDIGVAGQIERVVEDTYRYDYAGRQYAKIRGSVELAETLGFDYDNPPASASMGYYSAKGVTGMAGTASYTIFDERGNIIQTHNESGVDEYFIYDNFNRKVEERDGLYDGRSRTQKWYYDDFGRLLISLDNGVYSAYAYNRFGQLSKVGVDLGDSLFLQDLLFPSYGYPGYDYAVRPVSKYYEYYENGLIKKISQGQTFTSYIYDANGKSAQETNGYVSSGGVVSQQIVNYSHDELGRLSNASSPAGKLVFSNPLGNGSITIADSAAITSLRVSYDEFGNRRSVLLEPSGGSDTGVVDGSGWFKYDAENRVLVANGVLGLDYGGLYNYNIGILGNYSYNTNFSLTYDSDAEIRYVRGQGTLIKYDAAGRRYSELTANGDGNSFTEKAFSYDRMGALTTIQQRDCVKSVGLLSIKLVTGSTVFDSVGAYQTSYSQVNDLQGVSVGRSYSSGAISEINNYHYRGDGKLFLQVTTNSSGGIKYDTMFGGGYQKSVVNGAVVYTPRMDAAGLQRQYQTNYRSIGGSRSYAIKYTKHDYDAINGSYKDMGSDAVMTLDGSSAGASYMNYSIDGELLQAKAPSGSLIFDRRFSNSLDGRIIGRADFTSSGALSKAQTYFYYEGKPIASLGLISGNSIGVDFDPVSDHYPGKTPTTYTINQGDTLPKIAQMVWGDASLWYLIADANGLSADDDLSTMLGRVLDIPNRVTNIHNDADVYSVYDPSEIIGDTTPQPKAPPPPKPKKRKWRKFSNLIRMIVSAIVTVMTGSPTLGAGAGDFAGQVVSQIGNGEFNWFKGLASIWWGASEHYDYKQTGKAMAAGALTGGLTQGLMSGVSQLGTAAANLIAEANPLMMGSINYSASYMGGRLMGNHPEFGFGGWAGSVLSASVGNYTKDASVNLFGSSPLGDVLNAAAPQFLGDSAVGYLQDKWFGGGAPDYLAIGASAIARTYAKQTFGERKDSLLIDMSKKAWADTSAYFFGQNDSPVLPSRMPGSAPLGDPFEPPLSSSEIASKPSPGMVSPAAMYGAPVPNGWRSPLLTPAQIAENRHLNIDSEGIYQALTARNYTVQSGDQVSDLSKQWYDDPHVLEGYFALNGRNPNVLRAGEVITAPYYYDLSSKDLSILRTGGVEWARSDDDRKLYAQLESAKSAALGGSDTSSSAICVPSDAKYATMRILGEDVYVGGAQSGRIQNITATPMMHGLFEGTSVGRFAYSASSTAASFFKEAGYLYADTVGTISYKALNGLSGNDFKYQPLGAVYSSLQNFEGSLNTIGLAGTLQNSAASTVEGLRSAYTRLYRGDAEAWGVVAGGVLTPSIKFAPGLAMDAGAGLGRIYRVMDTTSINVSLTPSYATFGMNPIPLKVEFNRVNVANNTTAADLIASRTMSKAEWQDFYGDLRLQTREAAATYRGRYRGPVVSGVKDARTGEFFSGKNELFLPQDLHPLLADRVSTLPNTMNITALREEAAGLGVRWPYSTPGAHAEIHALNKALQARESAGIPIDLSEMFMVNRWLTKSAGPAQRCGYCSNLSNGVNALTDK